VPLDESLAAQGQDAQVLDLPLHTLEPLSPLGGRLGREARQLTLIDQALLQLSQELRLEAGKKPGARQLAGEESHDGSEAEEERQWKEQGARGHQEWAAGEFGTVRLLSHSLHRN
jgi:hypothetical protein